MPADGSGAVFAVCRGVNPIDKCLCCVGLLAFTYVSVHVQVGGGSTGRVRQVVNLMEIGQYECHTDSTHHQNTSADDVVTHGEWRKVCESLMVPFVCLHTSWV